MQILFLTVSFLASIAGAVCGIGGGIAGRMINKRISSSSVEKLFIGLMAIIAISAWNTYQYGTLLI